MRSPTIYCIVGVILIVSKGIAADVKSDVETAAKYRDLVQKLVSPNKEAETRNRASGSVKFPDGYDIEVQKRIKAARQELHDHFDEALPYLIEALDDKRYCMTIDWADGDAYYNKSVGFICRNVIESQLEVYRDKIGFSGPRHWHQYDYKQISNEWWQMRKGRSLVELQIEAIDWAIERREKENVTSDRRKDELSDLHALRDEIAKSGKPLKSQGMYPMVTSNMGSFRKE